METHWWFIRYDRPVAEILPNSFSGLPACQQMACFCPTILFSVNDMTGHMLIGQLMQNQTRNARQVSMSKLYFKKIYLSSFSASTFPEVSEL